MPTSTTRSVRLRRNARRRLVGAFLLMSGVYAASACVAVSGSDEAELPEFTAPLVDAADVVPDDQEPAINQELLSYQDRSGTQIAVAIVDTIGDQSLEDYSIDLAKEWGVGTEDDDNGILLFLAIQERRSRVEVGEGIEGEVTDLEAGEIVRGEMRPLLQEGDYGGAVLAGTRAIRRAIGDDEVPANPEVVQQPTDGTRESPRVPGWAFSVLPFVVFPLLFGSRRRRRSSPVYWGGGTVSRDRKDQRHLEDRRRRRDDDDDGSGWLGAAILGSILLGGGRDRGGWGGGDFGGGGGFDFGGGGGGDFGGGGASGDW